MESNWKEWRTKEAAPVARHSARRWPESSRRSATVRGAEAEQPESASRRPAERRCRMDRPTHATCQLPFARKPRSARASSHRLPRRPRAVLRPPLGAPRNLHIDCRRGSVGSPELRLRSASRSEGDCRRSRLSPSSLPSWSTRRRKRSPMPTPRPACRLRSCASPVPTCRRQGWRSSKRPTHERRGDSA
jgi:hypothetical protein